MPSVLPPEITFEILGQLSPSTVLDAQALRSASLSCSNLRPFCQKALFSRIVISKGAARGRGRPGPSDRLLEAFQTSPILATYVQSLAIKQDVDWVRFDLKLPGALEFLLEASAPITEFSCLLDLFVAWPDYPERTRKSIITLCTLPRLSHLALDRVPLENLHFGGLLYLQTFCIVSAPDLDPWLQRSREDHCHRGPPAQIGELIISPDQATLDFIVDTPSGLDLRALKVLTLVAPPMSWWEMSTDVAPLLDLCANSLVEIHLRSGNLRGQALILTKLINLQIITISVDDDNSELQYSSGLFLRLGTMLQTLPCPNSLQVVQLGEHDEPEVSLGPGQSCEAMQQLDSILSQPKFRSLQRLMLLVSAPSEEALIAQFPNLQQRGVLRLPGAQEEDGDMIVASASDKMNHIYR
ncbi:hypothetical protein BKA70DRAFT_1561675 [Coprinopsis sp. MPI-PUGE-AT-0042]|nr:hypothetical protein BKA70DRAFT_1561675 [Coprinopsis sp. MPI-PUGE-AT-0042]